MNAEPPLIVTPPPPAPDLLKVSPVAPPLPPPWPLQSTRYQRVALLVGVGVVLWLGLQLFSSVLMPFVAAAGIAYVLDPFCTRMERAKVPRGLAALMLVIGLSLVALIFVLLLYPLCAGFRRLPPNRSRNSSSISAPNMWMPSSPTWSAARPARCSPF
jgi:predicted PurR-regulated permease PerM